jgi:Acetyltransferase (GNAT) domain
MMYKFELAELSRENLSAWDELIDHSRQGTIFHKSDWLKTCAGSLGKKFKIFGCFQNDLLVGGCSLFTEHKWGLVSVANSNCSMTPYGGFVLSPPPGEGVHKNESFYGQIIGDLIREINKERYFVINILNSPDLYDIRPFTLNGWKSDVNYTYSIDLDDDLESHADHLVKKNIRKAERNNISIKQSSDISAYYALLCETYARKNLTPPCSESFITDLFSFVRGQDSGEMVVAKTPEDEIACAEIVLWDKRQAYAWSAVSDARANSSGAPTLLRFNDLKRMKDKGIHKMNMMTGNVPELSQFTAHFNPALLPYYHLQYKVAWNIIPW